MNEILRFMQKRDERTDGQKAFYNLPTTAFEIIKVELIQILARSVFTSKYNLQNLNMTYFKHLIELISLMIRN